MESTEMITEIFLTHKQGTEKKYQLTMLQATYLAEKTKQEDFYPNFRHCVSLGPWLVMIASAIECLLCAMDCWASHSITKQGESIQLPQKSEFRLPNSMNCRCQYILLDQNGNTVFQWAYCERQMLLFCQTYRALHSVRGTL